MTISFNAQTALSCASTKIQKTAHSSLERIQSIAKKSFSTLKDVLAFCVSMFRQALTLGKAKFKASSQEPKEMTEKERLMQEKMQNLFKNEISDYTKIRCQEYLNFLSLRNRESSEKMGVAYSDFLAQFSVL